MVILTLEGKLSITPDPSELAKETPPVAGDAVGKAALARPVAIPVITVVTESSPSERRLANPAREESSFPKPKVPSCRFVSRETTVFPSDHLNGAAPVRATLRRTRRPTRIWLGIDNSWNILMKKR
jgi:hypothetical protein